MGAASPINIVIAPDKLSATLTIGSDAPSEFLDLMLIEGMIRERSIVPIAELRDVLTALVADTRAAPSKPHSAVIARGTVPTPPIDGRIEFVAGLHPFHGEPETYAEAHDPTNPAQASQKIDYHTRSTLPIVHRGKPIGHFFEPKDGIDGLDVTGRAIASHAPRNAPLKLDDSILREGSGRLLAGRDGLLVQHESLLRIVGCLELPGNVDFSTGNIDFPGDVVVAKGVKDCFIVRAGRDLRVRDLVESANVHAGRDATLDRGMAGHGKGVLEVGRDLHVKYLEATHATVARDAFITAEATQCHLTVGRSLIAPNAAFIGGRLDVMQHGEVSQLGSEGSVSSVVGLGHWSQIEKAVAHAMDLLPEAEAALDRMHTKLDQLDGVHKSGAKLSASDAEALTEMQFEWAALGSKIEAFKAAYARCLDLIEQARGFELTIHRALHPKVKLQLAHFTCEPRDTIKGKLTIGLKDGTPVYWRTERADASPLSELCRVVPDPALLDLAKARKLLASREPKPLGASNAQAGSVAAA